MTDELKPCHCKRRPCIHRACINRETYQRFAVVCSCGMNTDYWESEKDAIDKWNTRPIEDALVAELNKMKSALREIQISIFRNADDTLWMFPDTLNETVCEFIDSTLGEDNCQQIAEDLDEALALAKGLT